MKSSVFLVLVLLLFTLLPQTFAQTTTSSAPRPVRAKLDRLFSDYWKWYMADNPGYASYLGDKNYHGGLYDFSEAAYRRRFKAVRDFLRRADAVPERGLSDEQQMSLKMLRSELRVALEGEPLYAYREDNYLTPINQIEGFHVMVMSLPTTRGFDTVKDYDIYIKTIAGVPKAVDDAIANMRRGIELGITLPKPMVELVIPQVQAGITADAKMHPLREPATRFPAGVSANERRRITDRIDRTITSSVVPGFAKLLAFLRDEYLPRARPTFAYADMNRGAETYRYAIKVRTTTQMSPEDLHQLGLRELERITKERQKLIASAGFTGTVSEFNQQMQADPSLRLRDAAAVESTLRKDLARIEERLPRLFSRIPAVPYELRPVEPFRAASFPGGAYFPPSLDAKRPGTFYYNTYGIETEGIRKFTLTSLAFHEVLPGHHFGAIYGRLNTALPEFRRFSSNAAYNEGWANYAESLADELGAYEDVHSKSFWLNSRTFSYLSRVVETGIHTKGWTLDEAYAFVRKYLPMPRPRFDSFVARWTAMPSQGLAYSVGALRIEQLREEARRELGPRFDVRRFHDIILGGGTLPLDLLSENVRKWIVREKAAAK